MEREFIFRDGQFFEVKMDVKMEGDMEDMEEEMEWMESMVEKVGSGIEG